MVIIHPSAIVHPDAVLGKDVEIGPFSIINDDVVIGEGCKIASHVLIDSGSRLGKNVSVFNGAVLGTAPQDLKYKGEKTYLEVGDNTIIREFVTLNRGTDRSFKTIVGQNCLLMAYVHVAHDCVIGSEVIIANAVNMGGHVVIEDFAGIGGITGIHQFVHIGQHAFVGGGFRVTKDVPPFILAIGDPLQYGGLNIAGLKRRDFSSNTLLQIKRAYKIIYRSGLSQKQAIAKLHENFADCPEVQAIAHFLDRSDRGIIKGI